LPAPSRFRGPIASTRGSWRGVSPLVLGAKRQITRVSSPRRGACAASGDAPPRATRSWRNPPSLRVTCCVPRPVGAGRHAVTISQDALRRLMAYHWPGNIRQLENAIERALAFSQGRSQIDVQDLTSDIQEQAETSTSSDVWFPDDGLDFARYIETIELALIRRSLERTQGNKRQAAKLLNLKRTTLIEKLKRLEPHTHPPKLP